MRTIFATVIATSVLCVAGAALAGPPATVYDHLECFKMRDSIGFNATVDLNPLFNNPGIPPQSGCRVAVKSKEICFPAEKVIVTSEEPTIPVVGQDLANGFLCYTVKCPFDGVTDFEASDQFGTRLVGRLKTSRLCVPADW